MAGIVEWPRPDLLGSEDRHNQAILDAWRGSGRRSGRWAEGRNIFFQLSNLRGARLDSLILEEQDGRFRMANLQGVDLTTVKQFIEPIVEGACMDRTTRLPEGFTPPDKLSEECEQYWRRRPFNRTISPSREWLSP